MTDQFHISPVSSLRSLFVCRFVEAVVASNTLDLGVCFVGGELNAELLVPSSSKIEEKRFSGAEGGTSKIRCSSVRLDSDELRDV